MRELRDALADPTKATTDENILAMLWMASAEIVPEDRRQRSTFAFNPPLPSDQWIDGSMRGHTASLVRNTAI